MADQAELPGRIQKALEAADYAPELIPGVPDEALLAVPGIGKASLKIIRQVYPKAAHRPTKYRPEFCLRVVELGADGMGRAEIAHELGTNRQTLHDWEAAHPAFADAMTRARDAALAWWEKQGRKGIWGGKAFNAQAYRLQVINRFPKDYRDKQEHRHSIEEDIEGMSTEELKQRAAELAERI